MNTLVEAPCPSGKGNGVMNGLTHRDGDAPPPGFVFWPIAIALEMNIECIMHPEMDMQKWFESRVATRMRQREKFQNESIHPALG
jgi:hypothetical protein